MLSELARKLISRQIAGQTVIEHVHNKIEQVQNKAPRRPS
jgi:hypothetical protein